MLKAPFRLPEGWLARFGYRQGRRFVAICWEPCGDEASYDDGISSAIGLSNNWLYLDFIRQQHVRRWLDENAIHLGNSDESAQHWLIADASTGELFASARRDAHAIVRAQQLTGASEGPSTT
jgi:hypothetical protein